MNMFLFMSIVISSMFLMMSHPISMMITIIIQALNLCFVVWMILNISWFSYITFLIYLGGVMILFIYISSMASNEKFFFSLKQITSQILFTLIFILLIFTIFSQTYKMKKYEFLDLMFNLYSSTLSEILLFSILYLLLTLVVVVKMTSFYEGPLRTKN